MKTRLTIATIFAGALVAAAPAFATDSTMLPAFQTQGTVSYVSGGVGEDQSDAFKRAAAEYPLELLFAQKATPRDEYLADVRVTIRDHTGNPVLETISAGPFLLANLPVGKYSIDAEYNGERKQQSVEVRNGKHRRAVFVWPTRDEAAGPVVGSTQ